MLFSSFIFLFGFLPVTLAVFYGLGRWRTGAKLALTLLSLAFYAVWRPVHLPLLLFSIAFNYLVGDTIQRRHAEGRANQVKLWLTLGVVTDLGLLAWFKYANFIADNLSLVSGRDLHLGRIALPLAISFFTFQKIGYLIDSARGEAKRIGVLDFALFAAFFPQLIAGPIVHYKEVVPQIRARRFGRLIWRNILVGLVMVSMGLFKKTVIADTLAAYANPMFAAAHDGQQLGAMASWLAAVSYTFQLYFDFSGYSDMAIGLGRMFGVKLPLNFHSPLRAASISDYWRRWHMTLQRFIVAYVFQPLSLPLNRLAATQGLGRWSAFLVGVGVPTFVTFVAIGIWHGAGWTFVLFGVLHALYVCLNAAWREWRTHRHRTLKRAGRVVSKPGLAEQTAYHLLTLLAVLFGNVLFRAATVGDALSVWRGMVALGGLGTFTPGFNLGLVAALFLSAFIIFFMPNTQQIMGRFDPAYNWREWRRVAPPAIPWTWRPSPSGLAFAGVALFLGVMFIQRGQAVFLYFNF